VLRVMFADCAPPLSSSQRTLIEVYREFCLLDWQGDRDVRVCLAPPSGPTSAGGCAGWQIAQVTGVPIDVGACEGELASPPTRCVSLDAERLSSAASGATR
jgi:hypothetical protein